MNPTMIVYISESILVLVFFILLTIRLIKRMREIKLTNLKWLVIFFAAQSVVGFTRMMYLEIAFYIIQSIILLSLIVFIKETFYKEQQSTFNLIFISEISLLATNLTLVIIRLIGELGGLIPPYSMLYVLDVYFLAIATMLASLWYASASFSAYKMAKFHKFDKETILRYKILGISAIFLALLGFVYPIHAAIVSSYYNRLEIDIFTTTIVSLSLLFAIGNFYAWIILGKKIERSKVMLPQEEELSEEEINKMFEMEG